MPLFGNKFSPKKLPARKSACSLNTNENLEELTLEHRVVQLNLGDQALTFENGNWFPESGRSSSAHKSNLVLKKQVQDLQEENNLLRVKYEIMLNMLTQKTAESQMQEREIEKLKNKTFK